MKHALKASTEDDRNDYYAIGTYNPVANKWIPDDETLSVGIGLRYDWGRFYASKTFFDPQKQRRVLWGWISETDSEIADIAKGWVSLQVLLEFEKDKKIKKKIQRVELCFYLIQLT